MCPRGALGKRARPAGKRTRNGTFGRKAAALLTQLYKQL